MKPNHLFLLTGAVLALATTMHGQTNPLQMAHETIFPGLKHRMMFPAGRLKCIVGAEEKSAKINHNGAEYDRPELRWTQHAFIQPQMMAEDRYFYDPDCRQIHG